MTTKRQETIERLQREYEVCDKHILRIREALGGLKVDMKEYRPIESEPSIAAEPAVAYGSVNTTPNSEKRMSRRDLEAECYSLEESKARLLELVNRHFHNR